MSKDLAVPKFKDTPMILRASQIKPGKNPRTYFDPVEMAELEEAIKAQGIMQPLLVRQIDEHTYEIIAGERRHRAATNVFGPEAEIPVLCREGADEAAIEAMAFSENVIRASMSVVEEAEQMERILKGVGGDKAEAARLVGMTDVASVNRLLAFLLLTPACRTALTHRKIKIGHAELLATVPAAKQDGALGKIIEHNISVVELKRQIGTLTNDLTTACFDKGECLNCPHNSAQQQVMFAEALEGSVCTNPPCFQAKVDGHLQMLADRLEQDVPKVIILRADTGITPIKLVAEGKGGVGAEQAEACKGCANFGATVSGLPGDEGTVARGMCFDAACNVKKVALHLRSQRTAGAATAGGAAGAKEGATPAADAGKQVRTPTVGAVSAKLKEYRVGQWRKMAAKVTYEHPELALSMLLSLVMSGHARHIDGSKLREVHRALTKSDGAAGAVLSITGAATAMVGVEANVVQRMLHACAASAFKDVPEGALMEALRVLNVREQDHWKLNTEYLTLLTKSEIEALAAELRLAQAAGDSAFKKLLAQPKPAFIAGLLAIEGVEYVGLVPQAMKYPRAAGADEADPDEDDDTQGASATTEAPAEAVARPVEPQGNDTATAAPQPDAQAVAVEATTDAAATA